MKLISQGAEAHIFESEKRIVKERKPKSYRLQILDAKIIKSRTKAEAKILEKAAKIIPVPKILSSDSNKIEMEKVKGKKLSDYLDKLPDAQKLCIQIGENIAKLHDAGIIHGDLTTSNMIFVTKSKSERKNKSDATAIASYLSNKKLQSNFLFLQTRPLSESSISTNKTSIKEFNRQEIAEQFPISSKNKVFFIDFGLSFHSNRIEDKAVDLHLIKQALEAKHYKNFQKFFAAILKGYQISQNAEKVIKQLEKVEKRGRYREQY